MSALSQPEAFARIRLLRSPNIGPVSYAQLLARFGGAEAAIEALPELGKRGAGDRYAAFLELMPTMIARETRGLTGARRDRALDAYVRTRELVAVAPRLSLDPSATVFQLGGILASVADPLP